MAYTDDTIVIENARIIFRNFAGKPSEFNRQGSREFSVLLDDDIAKVLETDGWNVKWLKPREEGDLPQAFLKVKVEFEKGRPPRVVLITSKSRTLLGADQVELLDWADIRNVDVRISPYNWEVNGKKGITAYLKSIFITIVEDPLEEKYANLDELPSGGGRVG